MQSSPTRPSDELIDSVQLVIKADQPLKFVTQLLQNMDGMFIKISKEVNSMTEGRRNISKKVNIPFSSAQDLINALVVMSNASIEGKGYGDNLASETFKSDDGSIFVVESFVGKEYYLVKISKNPRPSHKYGGLTIPRDAIQELVLIIKKFVKKFSEGVAPYEPKEELTREPKVRSNGSTRSYGRGGYRDQQSYPSTTTGSQRRPFGANSANREKPLAPIVEVTPVTFTLDRKEFRVEAVKGNRCFIRITEFISNSKKGTLHIPALHIAEFVASLNSVNLEIQKVPKDLFQDAPVAPSIEEDDQ